MRVVKAVLPVLDAELEIGGGGLYVSLTQDGMTCFLQGDDVEFALPDLAEMADEEIIAVLQDYLS